MKMNKIRFYISIFLLCMVLTLPVSAMKTGFITQEISEEKKNELISGTAVTPLLNDPSPFGFDSYNVDENGNFVLVRHIRKEQGGSAATSHWQTCVFSQEGTFLYGFEFEYSGSVYVELKGERVLLYHARSGYVFEHDSKGAILDIVDTEDTDNFDEKKHNDNYAALLKKNTKICGDREYTAKKTDGLMSDDFSQLWVEENETKHLVYDAKAATREEKTVRETKERNFIWDSLFQTARYFARIGISVIALLVVVGIIIFLKKRKRRLQPNRGDDSMINDRSEPKK